MGFIGVIQLQDGTILGVGTNNKLYTKATPQSNWVLVPQSCCVIGVTQLQDGTILGVGTNNKLYTKTTLESAWVLVPQSCCVIGVTQLQDGTILGVRTNNKLYTKATLESAWVEFPNNTGNLIGIAVEEVYTPKNIALGKPVTQSTTEIDAGKAVDGNRDGNYNNLSVSTTQNQVKPSWQVDLGAVYDITKIKLYNRTDCCAERLTDFSIWATPDGNWNKATKLDWKEASEFVNANTSCPIYTYNKNFEGRYVRVFLNGNGILSLAEVEVSGTLAPKNVALGKPATQSTTEQNAGKAVDGNRDGNYNNLSVSTTQNQVKPSWQVDLGAVHDITKIKLYNRTDCCAERLNNFTILVSETPFTGNSGGTAFVTNEPYATNPIRSFQGNSRGRYVRVFLNGTGILSLAEVEIFGEKIEEEKIENELYLVTIKTDKASGAGTNAKIEMRLHDNKGNSTPWVECDDPRENDFEQGMETTYILDAPTLAGTLKDIELRLTDNGTKNHSWKFHSARVDYSGGSNFKTNPNGQGNNAWFSDPANSTNLKSRKFPLVIHTSYSVTINTANDSGAGTDAIIEARLFDDKGNITPWVECNNEKNFPIISGQRGFNDFEQGMETTYILDVPSLQGALNNIEFRLTDNGTKNKAWKFQSAKVNYIGGYEYKTNPKGQGNNGWFSDPANSTSLKNRKYSLGIYTTYNITIRTTSEEYATTKGHVNVRLHGISGKATAWMKLEPIPFPYGGTVRFETFYYGERTVQLETSVQLGNLKNIELSITGDNAGDAWSFYSAIVSSNGSFSYGTNLNGQGANRWFCNDDPSICKTTRKFPLSKLDFVKIKTADASNAGTGGTISMRLFDDMGNQTSWVICDDIYENDFERNTEASYPIDISSLTGELKNIELKISGSDADDRWEFQSAEIFTDGGLIYETNGLNVYFCDDDPAICKEKKKFSLTVRPDPYYVTIVTADEADAGTDADIEARLYDKNGNYSDWVLCDDPKINDFERGMESTYNICVPKLAGEIKDIEFRISGSGADDAWSFSSAEVRYMGETAHYVTNVDEVWFCNDDDDCVTEKKFALASPIRPNVQIQLEKIICVKEDDGGGSAEELYGNMYVEINGEKQLLWSRSERNNMLLRKGEAYELDRTVFYHSIGANDVITLGGSMKEYDDGTFLNPNDNLGHESKSLTFQQLLSSNNQVIRFTHEGTVVDAHFKVSKPSGRYLHLKRVKCIAPSGGTDKWTTFGVAMVIEAALILGSSGSAKGAITGTQIGSKTVGAKVVATAAAGSISMVVPGAEGELIGMAGPSVLSNLAAKELIDFTLKVHGDEHDDLYLRLGGLRIWPHGRWSSIGSQETQVINQFYPLKNDIELEIMEYDKSDNDFMGSTRFLTSGGNIVNLGSYTVHLINENEGSYYELSYEILNY